MSAWLVVAIGVAVWIAVAFGLGVVVGRTVRMQEDRDDYYETLDDAESDMDVFLSMIESPSDPYRYRGEQ